MAIKYLHIKTKDSEELTLNDVGSFYIGTKDKFGEEFVIVNSRRGMAEFNTNDLLELDFTLVNEKEHTVLHIQSLQLEEAKGVLCNDTKDAQ